MARPSSSSRSRLQARASKSPVATLALLFSLLPLPTQTWALQPLSRRAVQSSATCLDQFSWMDNTLRQSPCIVAAYLLSACAGGNWNMDPIANASVHYTPPTVANANGCRCSWAVYNTLQACADCQGQDFESAMLSWSGYSTSCNATFLSDTEYYPESTPIPAETAIPFWATTNPTTWHDGIFDPSMAQSIANEDHSDITQSSRSTSPGGGSNTGAIVGGVIGGIIGLLIILGLIYFFFLRRRRHRGTSGTSILKSRPSVRFSPLSHWRTGSSASAGQTLMGASAGHGVGMGGKYAGQTQNAYAYNGINGTTPSPGPTLPVSMTGASGTSTGTGTRPPYNTMPSSSSFTTATASPPLGDYPMHTQPGKNYGIGAGYGYGVAPMALMNQNSQGNPASVSVSSAFATAAPSGVSVPVSVSAASGMARNSHAHTLSNDSAIYSTSSPNIGMAMGGDPPEGAITPFVLPPTLPEPMGAGAGDGGGGVRSPTPGLGGKNGHGRGPSDSSNNTNANANINATTTTTDLYTTATATATAPRRPPPERRNPPAYTPASPSPPPPPPPPGIVPGAGEEGELPEGGGTDDDMLSVEAQRAETTLSGTTLRGQSSSGRAPTTLAGDADAERPAERHAYPADRKT